MKATRERETSVLGTIVIVAGIGIWAGCELVAIGIRRLLGMKAAGSQDRS